MFRFPPALIATLLALCLVRTGRTQEPVSAVGPEAPAPAALPAVRSLLDEAMRLLREKRPAEARAAAARALDVAAGAKDLAGSAIGLQLSAEALEAEGNPREALQLRRKEEDAWRKAGDTPGQVRALCRQVLLLPERDSEASAQLQRALDLAQAETRRPLAAAEALHEAGHFLESRTRFEAAQRAWEFTVAIYEKHQPASLPAAAALVDLGNVARARRDLAEAKSYYQRALDIHQWRVPGSLEVAGSLTNLGGVALRTGDLPGAKSYYELALVIREMKAPGSLEVAASLGNLGFVSQARGDLKGGRNFFERALAIYEAKIPRSMALAQSLYNLGVVTYNQGDLARARSYYERALAIHQENAPNSIEVAADLNNLGSIALRYGDLAGARSFFERSLTIREAKAPGSLDVSRSLSNLGFVTYERGELASAERFFRRALANEEQRGPESSEVGNFLNNLGAVAFSLGNLAEAKRSHERALAIHQKADPGSRAVAFGLYNLGRIAERSGNLADARGYHERALAIRQERAPGSLEAAASLYDLAHLSEAQQDEATAERQWREAWRLVQSQATTVRGDEAGQAFWTTFRHYATSLLRVQFRRGDTLKAVVTLEESRAFSLRQLLAERGNLERLVGSEEWSRYQQAVGTQNRLGEALAQRLKAEADARRAGGEAPEMQAALAATTAAREKLENDYAASRTEAEALYAKLCASTPGLAATAADVDAARAGLPAGTVYLAFSIGQEECHLLALEGGRPEIGVHRLAITAEQLRMLTARFRLDSSLPTAVERDTCESGSRLYEVLVPDGVRAMIARSKRIVISPDDVLWEVPFAALVMSGKSAGASPRFLGLEKPLVLTPSLLLYHRTRPLPRADGGVRLEALVVGNPATDPALRQPGAAQQPLAMQQTAEGDVRTLTEDGTYPPPLPGAAEEAAAVAELYGTRAALGPDPTEAWLRQRVGSADLIHLATHGRFNPHRGMSSGVWLAAPDKPEPARTEDDGALQAWEIVSELKLTADLVVLSACETGRGAKVPGEGLIGLTRALQLAGARSIVASGWKVADESTKTLMVSFHRELRKGVAKDEALRRAMRAVALDQKHPEWRRPYFWSAFMLLGDPENRRLKAGPPE